MKETKRVFFLSFSLLKSRKKHTKLFGFLSDLIFYFFDFEEMNEGLSRVVFPSKKKSSKGGRPWNLFFSFLLLLRVRYYVNTRLFFCVVLLKYSLAGFLKFPFVLCLAQRSL